MGPKVEEVGCSTLLIISGRVKEGRRKSPPTPPRTPTPTRPTDSRLNRSHKTTTINSGTGQSDLTVKAPERKMEPLFLVIRVGRRFTFAHVGVPSTGDPVKEDRVQCPILRLHKRTLE